MRDQIGGRTHHQPHEQADPYDNHAVGHRFAQVDAFVAAFADDVAQAAVDDQFQLNLRIMSMELAQMRLDELMRRQTRGGEAGFTRRLVAVLFEADHGLGDVGARCGLTAPP